MNVENSAYTAWPFRCSVLGLVAVAMALFFLFAAAGETFFLRMDSPRSVKFAGTGIYALHCLSGLCYLFRFLKYGTYR